MPEQIKLRELEPGTLFKRGDTYAFKSEYRNDKGVCECFIIGSGEMFWGGTGNPNALKVEPICLEDLVFIESEYGKLVNEHAELFHFKEIATKHLTEEQLEEIADEIENVPDTNY